MSTESKKAALIHIYEILRKYSDANHLLELEEIADILEREYGVELERKAVSRNIDTLIEAGYSIEKTRRGCYLDEREFEDSELRLLIDSVLSSRHISAAQSKDLIKRLCNLSSKHFRPRVKHIHTVDEWNKTDNKSMFYNIEIIDEAIEKKRKIRFALNSYGIDKKLHATREHIVSPIRILMKDQRYYLLCAERYDEGEGDSFARLLALDRLSNMTITKIKAEKHEIEAASYEQILREHPQMEPFFFGEAEYITFACPEARIDKAIAAFGKGISIAKLPALDYQCVRDIMPINRINLNEHFVKFTVKTTSYSARQFVHENAPFTMVLAPEKLKRSIEKDIRRQYKFSKAIERELEKDKEKEKHK